MEFATCCGEMILNYTIKAAWQQVRYIVFYKRNIEELRGKANQLVDKQSSVQHQIDEATRNGDIIEDEVQNWMVAVNEIRERVRQMDDNEREERESRCPNLKSRYQLGKRAMEMAKEVDSRLNQSFARISYCVSLQALPDMAIIGESNEGYESRVSIVNEIIDALRDPNVRMIGLCGTGGVGKTTTTKEVARKVKGDMFETVIMVEVTDCPDREKIQREIAERVDMKLNDETEYVRASRLHERLKQEKNMLLILDDLWEKLEFSKIGIPSESKVLLTSRKYELLANEMKCQKVIKVGFMSKEDAWKLFTKEIVELPNDSETLSIANEIVGRCGGLPIRIVAAAGTLKNKEIDEWKDVLQRLKSPLQRNNTGIEKADDIFRVSYDRLSRESKPVFLLSAMLSHNPMIEDLMMFSVGLGLLQGVNTMEGALVRIHSLINQLKASNLLIDSFDNNQFAIHDVVRDFALSVALNEEHALVVRHDRQSRWPDKNQRKEYCSLCLDNCDINDLPEQLSCPNLQFFLLNNKNSDLKIPTLFFQTMNELKVMTFIGMRFPCLPSLQSLQEGLQTLCLHSCVLEDIDEVGNLKSLTVLSLAHSDIKRLPWELSQLTKLQMLNLAYCSKLKVIPPKLLSNLKRLEVLDMRESFKQWEAEGDRKGNRNASVDELKHLTNLSSLTIRIPDASVLSKVLFKDIPLERYKILITGKHNRWPYKWGKWRSDEYRMTLDIQGIYLDDGIQKLLENVEELCLDEVKGNAKVLCDLHGRGYLKLKRLMIQNSRQFDYVISNSTGPVGSSFKLVEINISRCESMKAFMVSTQQNFVSNDAVVFPQMRALTMSDLPMLLTFYSEENTTNNECNEESKSLFNSKVSFPKLEIMRLVDLNWLIPSIWNDQLPHDSFTNLKTLIVRNCGFVERLIPFHVLKSLINLDELEVSKCEWLEMVFDFEELNIKEKEIHQLPWVVPLKKLKLSTLPELKHVWHSDSQEMKFFHEKVSFPKLEQMSVKNCGFVERLIPFHVLKSLSNLKELEVHFCESLEMVFDIGELNNYAKEIHHLPWVVPLKKLQLRRLPKLKRVWSNDPQEMVSFQNLREVEASYCEILTCMFPASIAKRGLLQLKKLTIEECRIDVIVAKDEVSESDAATFVFPELTYLSLYRLPNLMNFYPSRHVFKWPKIQELYISSCDELEMFQKQVSSSSILEHQGHDTYPLFFQEKVGHNSKRLDLDGKLAMMIWSGQFPEKHFHNVQHLSLKLDGSVSFAYDRFPNLQELQLSGWVKEFMPLLVDVAPSKLTTLVLKLVKCLKHIWNEHSQQNSFLQNIKTLQVSRCDDLINLGTSFIDFTNLTDIHVSRSERLTSLMTPSTSRSLVQLTKLTISFCDKIEEIITTKQEGEEEDDVEKEIVFQKLESLTLLYLPRLRSFCGHCYTLRLPSLEKVIILHCGRMSMFCAGNIHTPSLECLTFQKIEDEKLLDNNLNKTIQLLLTQVTRLELNPEMRNIWNEKLPHPMAFSRLRHLIVDNCDFSSEYVIPAHLVRSLSKLKVLEVRNCHAIKTIFDLKGADLDEETHKLLANIRLKKLKLNNLPNLQCVWIQDLDESTCFQQLEKLYVGECESLKNIFVASTAKGLGQLKKLSIVSCGVEVIIAKDETSKESPNFVFPQLSYLKLDKLPNLKCFYPGRCTIFEWPQLTDLVVSQCENLKLFGTESGEDDEVETRPPLFLAEKVIPKLESLSLSQKDIVTFERNGQFQAELFHKVQTLFLESFVGESIAFPYDFLGRFPNLNLLAVNHCSFEEIFPSQVQHVGDMREIAPFKKLSLTYLDELKTIWNDDVDSQLPPLAQNLERLKVECCCSLIKLTPSLASLQNLTHLKVSGCHQLIYLVTNSTAKSLMNLTKLVIMDCKNMEEIITNENNDAEGETTFNNLWRLKLSNLPILKSFCLKNQDFKFPELESLTIRECHQMKMFCHGVLETPKLRGLKTEEGRTPLEGDLNKTIELFISEKGQLQLSVSSINSNVTRLNEAE